jgi:hypothetical protein
MNNGFTDTFAALEPHIYEFSTNVGTRSIGRMPHYRMNSGGSGNTTAVIRTGVS